MVEWKKLGEVCAVHTGSQLNRDDMIEDGLYPVVNGGREVSGYTNSYNERGNSITISQGGESAGYVNWIITDFWAGAHCYVVEHKDIINRRYLYHVLKNKERDIQQSKQGAGIPGLNKNTLYKQDIPIFPLAEQTRIVGILDTFTSAIDNLKEQIAQRRKQYEYYRDQLLDLEGKPGVEMKTLGEVIISLKTGLNPRKNFILNEVGSNKPYITGKDIFANRINVTDKTDMINEIAVKLINRRACLESGLLLFASTGTGTVGRMAIIEQYNNDWAMSETLYAIKTKENLSSKYLMYFLYSENAKKQFEPKISKGSVPHLKVVDLLNVVIPIPHLSEQQRIVSILDTFEASIQNLEAQLKEREKQYEYYRNNLLKLE